jgi:predicted esterase
LVQVRFGVVTGGAKIMKTLSCCALLLAMMRFSLAQDPQSVPAGPEKDPAAVQLEYIQLQRELMQLFEQKKYEEAANVCRKVIKLAPNRPDGPYNLACCLARLGKTEEALAALADSVKVGWLDSDHMEKDADLDSLRQERKYAELLATIKANEEKTYVGKDIEGTKKLVGLPEGGLRYRLRMSPEASREKPNRLIVWAHPSGGSMNDQVEAMAAMMAGKGWVLLVFTQKNFAGWHEDDVPKLLKTLEVVGKIEGINAERPLLLGYSAGGQLALSLWAEKPGRWGGLVLDAAYPIDPASLAAGAPKVLDPPKNDAVKKCPMLVLVGQKTGGWQVWKKVEDAWRAAGVPLVIHYIPNKGHAWLFDKEETARLKE